MLKSGEIRYYLEFCIKRPHIWIDLFSYVSGRIDSRVRTKINAIAGVENRLDHYPDEIRDQAKKICSDICLQEKWLDCLPDTGWSPGSGPDLSSWPIPLATYSLNLNDLNWTKYEEDRENIFGLHRFGWLLRWLSLRPKGEYIKTTESILVDWIGQVTYDRNRLAWETYSASERVINWLLYLCATKSCRTLNVRIANVIAASLLLHLRHIAQHLEYYDKSCNNHILNNARALYIGGQLLQLPQFSALAVKLFRRHLPELIDKEGALLEGSSHYQLLLTRTIVEVTWAARETGDQGFYDYIAGIALSMVSCCRYIGNVFSCGSIDKYPQVGDMSPDYPVSWFYPMSVCDRRGESWWGLWDCKKITSAVTFGEMERFTEEGPKEWTWSSGPDNTFSMLIYNPQSCKSYPAAHGHLDFGNFLLYDAKGPILVDRGRSSYSSDEFSRYGYSARAHNTTLINGLPLIPDCRGIFTAYKEYLGEKSVEMEETDVAKKISWRTNALGRFGSSISWERTVVLSVETVDMHETMTGIKNSCIATETYFHWAPGWKVSPQESSAPGETFLLANDGRTYRFGIDATTAYKLDWFTGDSRGVNGWHCPDYGNIVNALTLRVKFRPTKDYSLRITLSCK